MSTLPSGRRIARAKVWVESMSGHGHPGAGCEEVPLGRSERSVAVSLPAGDEDGAVAQQHRRMHLPIACRPPQYLSRIAYLYM